MEEIKKEPPFLSLKSISFVVRMLTAADTVVGTALGMVAPIFAVFIIENIQGGTIAVVGIASSLYLFSRSIFQIPVAHIADRIKGERDDFIFLSLGWLVFALVPIGYIFADTPLLLYGVQVIYGIGSAMVSPTWNAMFTKHIDKGKEALEWGTYQTIVDLAGAFAASIGGFVAGIFGFAPLLMFVSGLAFVSWFFIIGLRHELRRFKGYVMSTE